MGTGKMLINKPVGLYTYHGMPVCHHVTALSGRGKLVKMFGRQMAYAHSLAKWIPLTKVGSLSI